MEQKEKQTGIHGVKVILVFLSVSKSMLGLVNFTDGETCIYIYKYAVADVS